MTTLLLSLWVRLASRWIWIVESLEQPVFNPAAKKYRIAAFVSFAVTGLLAIPAAIIHSAVGECDAFNILGFGALAALALCLSCGLGYGHLNALYPPNQILRKSSYVDFRGFQRIR
jgi:hypothetical protein